MQLEWVLRPVFGVLLAALALGAMVAGGVWFAGLIALGMIAGVREWHRMIRQGAYGHYALISGAGVAVAMALPVWAAHDPSAVSAPFLWGFAALGLAAAIDAGLSGALGAKGQAGPLWQGFGPLYLGVPGLSLLALRATPTHGLWLVAILFAAVWATDTGAMISGKLIGGPKLAPILSPNKTWAGFAGGTIMAAVAVAAILAVLGASPVRGAAFGTMVALVSQVGDLFESWIKRRVGRKDSGHLIPGHGGVLDRIDSILFAAPACAAFLFVFGAGPIFGVLP
jgi:phosphatidate cytidylyltransferase